MLNFTVIRLQIFLQIHIFTNITKNSKDEGLISTQSWILCWSWKTRTEHKVGDEKKRRKEYDDQPRKSNRAVRRSKEQVWICSHPCERATKIGGAVCFTASGEDSIRIGFLKDHFPSPALWPCRSVWLSFHHRCNELTPCRGLTSNITNNIDHWLLFVYLQSVTKAYIHLPNFVYLTYQGN